jgi:molybdate transport system ATP-binding protein
MGAELLASFKRRYPRGAELRVEGLALLQERGPITVLFGASGSGKTTLLRCLAGLECPDAGHILFADETWCDVPKRVHLPPQQRRVGFVAQDYALFPHLTVAANVAYGAHALEPRERRRQTAHALAWLGLDGLERRLPSEISGGERQRVALARAVARRPQLLLLDEPLSALDGPIRRRLRGDLRSLLLELALPTLIVTHDRGEASALGDELVIVDRGRVLQHGPTDDVFARPAGLAAAQVVGVETLVPGRVVDETNDLATVAIGSTRVVALAPYGAPAREVTVSIRAENVVLLRGESLRSSARNVLPASVDDLVPEGPVVRVVLDCGFKLNALVTRQACEDLELRAGERLMALIKAPHVHLIAQVESPMERSVRPACAGSGRPPRED